MTEKERLATTELLQAIGDTIQLALNGDVAKEKRRYGFVLLTFELHAKKPHCNYLSSVDRPGAIANLRELANRLESQLPKPKVS